MSNPIKPKGRKAVVSPTAWFRQDEEGSVTSFTLIVFFAMLLAGGMGIDFLRFKAEQTRIQDIGDRAVLAAAKIDNAIDPTEVVKSYFEANGAIDNLIGAPKVQNIGNYKHVTVDTTVDVGTFFLPLAGIPSLGAEMQSVAIQGVGDIEISLVLDISYSMRGAKIAELRKAALAFAQSSLSDDFGGSVSLNVIAYSGNVNIGKPMFDYLETKSFLDGVQYSKTLIAGEKTPNDTSDDVVYPDNMSHCREFEDADFINPFMPTTGGVQTPHFIGLTPAIPYGAEWWCPLDGGEIRYAQQTAGDVKDPKSLAHFLANLPMGLGTSTHIGTKYGLALLDPSSRHAFAHLQTKGIVPDDFADRPKGYDQPGVQKILIVMTDGAVWHSRTPKNIFDPRNLTSGAFHSNSRYKQTKSDADNVKTFHSLCDMAKAPSRNIAVYTVAFAANKTAQNEMRECASSDAFFYNAATSSLTNVFEEIAGRISELRLVN